MLSDMKFMNTCSFIIRFTKISTYEGVCRVCVCFGELEKASSSFKLTPFTYVASCNVKD